MTLGEFKPPKRDSEFYFQIFLSFLAKLFVFVFCVPLGDRRAGEFQVGRGVCKT